MVGRGRGGVRVESPRANVTLNHLRHLTDELGLAFLRMNYSHCTETLVSMELCNDQPLLLNATTDHHRSQHFVINISFLDRTEQLTGIVLVLYC